VGATSDDGSREEDEKVGLVDEGLDEDEEEQEEDRGYYRMLKRLVSNWIPKILKVDF
jgi:hypothetical protein